jgi:hypothetical protein
LVATLNQTFVGYHEYHPQLFHLISHPCSI